MCSILFARGSCWKYLRSRFISDVIDFTPQWHQHHQQMSSMLFCTLTQFTVFVSSRVWCNVFCIWRCWCIWNPVFRCSHSYSEHGNGFLFLLFCYFAHGNSFCPFLSGHRNSFHLGLFIHHHGCSSYHWTTELRLLPCTQITLNLWSQYV